MAATHKLFGQFNSNMWAHKYADLSAVGTVIKAVLVTSTYTFSQGTHATLADITNEITGTGYTAGGATVTNKAVTYSSRVSKLDFDDVSWAGATFTARGVVFADATTGVAATSYLISFGDFGADMSPVSTTFQLAIGSGGLITDTVAA